MGLSTASGPWRSLGGFITPVVYVRATDVVAGEWQIPYAGANVVILSEDAGGPTGNVDFILPEVVTADGEPYNLMGTNGSPLFNGVQGSITNYAADRTYTLKGANGQLVSGVADVTIATGAVVQWASAGNPDLAWIAISNAILAA